MWKLWSVREKHHLAHSAALTHHLWIENRVLNWLCRHGGHIKLNSKISAEIGRWRANVGRDKINREWFKRKLEKGVDGCHCILSRCRSVLFFTISCVSPFLCIFYAASFSIVLIFYGLRYLPFPVKQ